MSNRRSLLAFLIGTLLLATHAAAASETHRLQNRLAQARETGGAWLPGFCAPEQATSWTNTFEVEGAAHAKDLLLALQLLWCPLERPDAQRMDDLRQRLPADRSRASRRVRTRLLQQAEDVQTFWYQPYDIFLSVSNKGQRVRLSTSREGGGDEFDWRFAGGRWLLVAFSGGGAC